ncbi:MAG: YdcF family protein [Spirochaetaceae bacterium]
MNRDVLDHARVLWDYFCSHKDEVKADVIVVCCSYDLRVCDYACDIFNTIDAKKIIFSGDRGNWTRGLWNSSEALIFKERAVYNGIDESNICIEERATNLGENILFSKKFLNDDDKILYVSKANTLLRIKLTYPVHNISSAAVSGPTFNFPHEVSNTIGVVGLINEMVGDINRIIKYPDLGYQLKHDIPPTILNSYNFLIQKGYMDHLLK